MPEVTLTTKVSFPFREVIGNTYHEATVSCGEAVSHSFAGKTVLAFSGSFLKGGGSGVGPRVTINESALYGEPTTTVSVPLEAGVELAGPGSDTITVAAVTPGYEGNLICLVMPEEETLPASRRRSAVLTESNGIRVCRYLQPTSSGTVGDLILTVAEESTSGGTYSLSLTFGALEVSLTLEVEDNETLASVMSRAADALNANNDFRGVASAQYGRGLFVISARSSLFTVDVKPSFSLGGIGGLAVAGWTQNAQPTFADNVVDAATYIDSILNGIVTLTPAPATVTPNSATVRVIDGGGIQSLFATTRVADASGYSIDILPPSNSIVFPTYSMVQTRAIVTPSSLHTISLFLEDGSSGNLAYNGDFIPTSGLLVSESNEDEVWTLPSTESLMGLRIIKTAEGYTLWASAPTSSEYSVVVATSLPEVGPGVDPYRIDEVTGWVIDSGITGYDTGYVDSTAQATTIDQLLEGFLSSDCSGHLYLSGAGQTPITHGSITYKNLIGYAPGQVGDLGSGGEYFLTGGLGVSELVQSGTFHNGRGVSDYGTLVLSSLTVEVEALAGASPWTGKISRNGSEVGRVATGYSAEMHEVDGVEFHYKGLSSATTVNFQGAQFGAGTILIETLSGHESNVRLKWTGIVVELPD